MVKFNTNEDKFKEQGYTQASLISSALLFTFSICLFGFSVSQKQIVLRYSDIILSITIPFLTLLGYEAGKCNFPNLTYFSGIYLGFQFSSLSKYLVEYKVKLVISLVIGIYISIRNLIGEDFTLITIPFILFFLLIICYGYCLEYLKKFPIIQQYEDKQKGNSFYKNCLSLIPEGVAFISQGSELLYANKQIRSLLTCPSSFLVQRIMTLQMISKPTFVELDYLKIKKCLNQYRNSGVNQQVPANSTIPVDINSQFYILDEGEEDQQLDATQIKSALIQQQSPCPTRSVNKKSTQIKRDIFNDKRSASDNKVFFGSFNNNGQIPQPFDKKKHASLRPNQDNEKIKTINYAKTRTFDDAASQDENSYEEIYKEKERSLQQNISIGTFDTSIILSKCKNLFDIYQKIFPKTNITNTNLTQTQINTNNLTTQQFMNNVSTQQIKINIADSQSYNQKSDNGQRNEQKIIKKQDESNRILKNFNKQKTGKNDINFLQKNNKYPYMIKFKVKVENKILEIKVIKFAMESLIDKEVDKGIMLLVQDVSIENKLSELKELDQYKTKMLASVSHELRTPLNCSLSMLEKLQSQIPQSLNLDLLQPALNSQKLLLSLINDILDFSQINAGKFSFVFQKFSLKRNLQEAIRLIQIQAEIKKLELKFEYDSQLPKKIVNDPNRLRQIMINLLGNALKFTKKGFIKVKAEKIKSDPLIIKISVSDSGIGIPEKDMEKIFAMFGKVDSKESRKLNNQGCGLGLAISNNLTAGIGPQEEESGYTSGLKVTSIEFEGSVFSFYIEDKGIQQDEKQQKDNYGQLSPNILDSEEEDGLMNNDITLNLDNTQQKLKQDFVETNPNITYESQTPLNLSIDNKFLAHSIKKPQVFRQKLYKVNSQHINLQCQSPTLPKIKRQLQQGTYDNVLQQIEQKQNFSFRFKQFVESYKNCTCVQAIIVDDNQFNVIAFQKTLVQYFSKIEYYFTGEDCIQQCRKMKQNTCCQGPLIIFMDMEMPEMNGCEVTQNLLENVYESNYQNYMNDSDQNQSTDQGYKPYIIGCSADNNVKDIERATQSGMKNYIVKPVKQKELEKALQKYQVQIQLTQLDQQNYTQDKIKFFQNKSMKDLNEGN